MEETENRQKGSISVEAANIFPVIKQWLYSDKEIFLREIVSNACDAVTKLRRLEGLGQISLPEGEKFRVDVVLNKKNHTLTVSDNGIGMTRAEVDRYICNIALSGALEFMEKYEKESASNGIIGHFGLGFYSAFMVSDKVTVRTKSYMEAPTTLWVCDEDGNYDYEEAEEERTRGTDIIMHLSESGDEFENGYKIKGLLEKYCAFMPVEIYFTEISEEIDKENEEKEKENQKKREKGEEVPEEKEQPVNDTTPLWTKNASDCTEEEYTEFYRKVFHDYKEPLFHIHINADYPLNFKGILYFPKIQSEYENLEGQVKLYYNQVFVADNIKEVIPEYFLMLRGVLDCPDLPLNVSRSYLQNSGYVSKISAHIVKKVADKLNALCNTEREKYEKIWEDLKLFVEYGSLKNRKFFDRVKESYLFVSTDGKYLRMKECIDEAKNQKIYYTTDKVSQAQYVSMYKAQNLDVLVLDKVIDAQFISLVEEEYKVKFLRVDAEISDELKGEGEELKDDSLKELFKKSSGNDKLTVEYTVLKDENIPAILNISEEDRRMSDMMKMYGMEMPANEEKATLLLNSNSSLVKKLSSSTDEVKKEAVATQIYSLALLSQRQLTAEELQSFLNKSYEVLELGL